VTSVGRSKRERHRRCPEQARVRTRKALSSRPTSTSVPQPRCLARRRQATLAEARLGVRQTRSGRLCNRPLRLRAHAGQVKRPHRR
jgi:hypothetical protein